MKTKFVIGAVLVLVFIAFLVLQNGERSMSTQNTVPVIPHENPLILEDIADVYAVQNTNDLHDQYLGLNEVIVSRVVSDRLFYVHQGDESQQVLVYDGADSQGSRVLKAGDEIGYIRGTLAVSGSLTFVEDDESSQEEIDFLKKEQFFLRAIPAEG